MHTVNHPLTVGECLTDKVHGIPCIIASPILPILYDSIERNLQFSIVVNHLKQFLLRLVTFATLPIAKGPKREHRNIARQLAHTPVHSVGIPAIHKIIVGTITHLGTEGHALGIVLKVGTAIVVPKDSPAFYRLDYILEILEVRLLHMFRETTSVEASVLHSAETINGFILVERVSLTDYKPPFVGTLRAWLKGYGLFL